MSTFEEQVVKSYYNLKGYFTIENIPFRASKKTKGGKGRGEIDLIAIKINKNNGRVEEAIHVEVSASITEGFPFKSNEQKSDDVEKIINKFFTSGVDNKLKEFYDGNYEYHFITGFFKKDVKSKLEEILKYKCKHHNCKSKILDNNEESISVEISYNGKTKKIIIPFVVIIDELLKMMKNRTEHFLVPTLRAFQWINKVEKRKNKKFI